VLQFTPEFLILLFNLNIMIISLVLLLFWDVLCCMQMVQ